MSTQEAKDRLELLEGTPGSADPRHTDLWINGLAKGSRAIHQTSEEELLVEHGALYPNFERLEERGCTSVKWELRQITGRRGFIP